MMMFIPGRLEVWMIGEAFRQSLAAEFKRYDATRRQLETDWLAVIASLYQAPSTERTR